MRDHQAPSFIARPEQTRISEDEAAIRALLRQLGEQWNRRDGKGFGAGFTEDADYIVFNGAHLKGREQIAEVHQKLFDTVLKGSKLGTGGETETVRFLRPDVALVHSGGGVLRPGQAEVVAEQQSVQTFVVVKQDGKWLITAFQNTRVQPQGGRPAKP